MANVGRDKKIIELHRAGMMNLEIGEKLGMLPTTVAMRIKALTNQKKPMPNVELNLVDLENVKRGLESLLVNLDTDPRMEEASDDAVAGYSQSLQATLEKVEAAINAR